jgi:hypothetical protein
MVMDVTATITVSAWRTLEPCCNRVVSAAGRLSVRIFGLDTCLGEAREPTNIRRNLGKLEARGWALRTPVKASQLWLVDGILPYGLI